MLRSLESRFRSADHLAIDEQSTGAAPEPPESLIPEPCGGRSESPLTISGLFTLWQEAHRWRRSPRGAQRGLAALMKLAGQHHPACRGGEITPDVLAQSWACHGHEPMEALYRLVAEQLVPDASFFHFRASTVDSVEFELNDTPLNEWAFGRPSAPDLVGLRPRIVVVGLVDLASRVVKDAVLADAQHRPQLSGQRLLSRLDGGDLLLFSHHHPWTEYVPSLRQRGVRFVGEAPFGLRCKTVRWLGDGDTLVRPRTDLFGDSRQGSLRLLECDTGSGASLGLLTNLLDPRLYPAGEVIAGFLNRLGPDRTSGELTETLTHLSGAQAAPHLRAATPDGVLEECNAVLLAHTLVREIMVEASRRRHLSSGALNFSTVMVQLRQVASNLQEASLPGLQTPRSRLLVRHLLATIAAGARHDRPLREELVG